MLFCLNHVTGSTRLFAEAYKFEENGQLGKALSMCRRNIYTASYHYKKPAIIPGKIGRYQKELAWSREQCCTRRIYRQDKQKSKSFGGKLDVLNGRLFEQEAG